MKQIENNVVIYGLGYVGLTLGIVLAESGYNVIGVEKNKNKISQLNRNKVYLHEPNINERFSVQKNAKKLIFTTHSNNITANTHVICVGTPLNFKTKKPKIDSMKEIIRSLINSIKKGDLVIVRSTVPIGFTRNFICEQISKKTKMQAGEDFFICFAPERTIEGDALEELRKNPQIIAGSTSKCLERGTIFFERFCNHIVSLPNLESSELAKLTDNTFRDVTFAYSNELAMIADNYNLNIKKIINACNVLYSRNNIPMPSPGVGGPCLTKDPYILIDSAIKKNYHSGIVKSARNINKNIILKLSNKIIKKIKTIKNPNLIICGLAFKGNPETNDYRDSTTLELINILKKRIKGVRIYIYDPVIDQKEIKKLGYQSIGSPYSKVNATALIIANNHHSFKQLNIQKIKSNMINNKVICDCWGLLNFELLNKDPEIDYFGVGF